MDLPVIDEKGQPKTTLAASDELFGRAYNEAVVHQVVTAYLANARLGTRKQKARGEVNKSNKKPWRQKGTGRARQGSIRSPQWIGGGVVWGPHQQSFKQDMPRKMRRLAVRSALSASLSQPRSISCARLRMAPGRCSSASSTAYS